jgi:LPS export ABC transporter protein LptC
MAHVTPDPKSSIFNLQFSILMPRPLILALALVFAACEGKVTPPASSMNGKAIPSQEGWNSQVTFTDSGRTRAILQAGHVQMLEEKHQTIMDSGVTVDFYSLAGAKTSTLTSNVAVVEDQTNNMTARGNVRAVGENGSVVTTELLMWDSARKKLHSDQFVRITSTTEVLQGYGFEADQDLRNYVIYRPSGQKY